MPRSYGFIVMHQKFQCLYSGKHRLTCTRYFIKTTQSPRSVNHYRHLTYFFFLKIYIKGEKKKFSVKSTIINRGEEIRALSALPFLTNIEKQVLENNKGLIVKKAQNHVLQKIKSIP